MTVGALLAAHSPTTIEVMGTAAIAVTAVAGAVTTAMVARAGLGNRRFVRSLILALAIVGVGAGLGVLGALRWDHGPLTFDLASVAATVVLLSALVHHPDLGPPRQRARVLADALIAGLSMAILLWLVAGRALFHTEAHRLESLALVASASIGFVITRVGLVVTLPREGRMRSASALLTVAFGICACGVALRLLGETRPSAPVLLAAGYGAVVVGILLVSLTGLMLTRPIPGPRPQFDERRTRALLEITPVLTASVAGIAVLIDAAARGRFDATALAVLTVVLTAVLLRQSLMLADNRVSTSLRHTVDELAQQATHDALTGLPNRLGLDERITAAVQRAAAAGTVCAVYFVDVDRLKAVNDSLGHEAGDQLIRTTAARLTACVGDRVTRFGGDEFVLVVDDLTTRADAEQLGRRIIDDTARSVSVDGHSVRSSSSVGLAVATSGVGAPELLRQADVALYRAKAQGRRCAARYRPDQDPGRRAELDLEPELLRAVDRDEFTLHYQPIVALGTSTVVSAESLLRWEHPRRGLLTPDRFLDQAISAGVLGTIGEASLRRACSDFASLDPALVPTVAVNLSGTELADTRVVERVTAALAESGLDRSRLTLEITEDVIVDDTVRAAVDELAGLGVHLAIDDFGTGNSSLRQVGAYPADVLKIDKTFVDRLVDDARARAITATVVRLAGELGLTTVAEGVETVEQAALLQTMGCDRAQGWLFAPAMPLEQFQRWCRTGAAARAYTPRRERVSSASSAMRASSSATLGRSSIAPTT